MEVRHQGEVYAVRIARRATARRLILRVRADNGEVVLTLPSRTPLAQARDFLDRHGGWIAARVARLPDRIACVDGALIPIRGVDHRIVHREAVRGAVRVETAGHAGGPPSLVVSCGAAHLERRVLDHLKAEARRDLAAATARHAARLGVTIARITIKDTRSRWGSCSSRGAIAYSWRIIMAPTFVLDYLAAHEVAHRREMNHSPRYWKVVEGLYPGWREAESWLTRHGAGLHRYGPAGGAPFGC